MCSSPLASTNALGLFFWSGSAPLPSNACSFLYPRHLSYRWSLSSATALPPPACHATEQARVKRRSRVLFIIYYSRVYLREAKAKGRKRRIDSSVQGLEYSYRCLVPSVAVSSTVIAASGVEMPNRH